MYLLAAKIGTIAQNQVDKTVYWVDKMVICRFLPLFLCVFRYFSPPKCPLRHKYSDFFRNDG